MCGGQISVMTSPFDKLRMRTFFNLTIFDILMLSLSKHAENED
jgi:hypothetical protein